VSFETIKVEYDEQLSLDVRDAAAAIERG